MAAAVRTISIAEVGLGLWFLVATAMVIYKQAIDLFDIRMKNLDCTLGIATMGWSSGKCMQHGDSLQMGRWIIYSIDILRGSLGRTNGVERGREYREYVLGRREKKGKKEKIDLKRKLKMRLSHTRQQREAKGRSSVPFILSLRYMGSASTVKSTHPSLLLLFCWP